MGNVFNRYGAGGGKSEGLYIWKKSEIKERSEMNSTSALKFDTTPPTENTITWYCGYSYTIENNEFVIDVDHRINNTNGVQTQFTETTPVYYMPRSNRGTKMVQTISTTATYVVGSSSTIGIYASAGVNNPINKFFIEKEFIGYVVSDKEDAYPDGGEQGGFYYERFEPFNITGLLGLNHVFVGSVTLTGTQRNLTITHNMGVVPKMCYLWGEKDAGNVNMLGTSFTIHDTASATGYTVQIRFNNTTCVTGGTASTGSRTELILYSNSSYMFEATTYHYVVVG